MGISGVSSTIIAITLVSAAIWVFIEFERFKHKLIAIGLIGLILFSYFSFSAVFGNNDLNLKSPKGWFEGSRLYFSWLASTFDNVKTITSNAISLDWLPDNRTTDRNT